MQLSKVTPVRSLERRKQNKFIVISHMRNFSLRLNPLIPDLKGFLPYFTTNKLRQYYRENIERNLMPFHFHSNQILGDWETIVSTPLTARSDLITRAVDNGYINSIYEDAIVIAIQDDYALRIPNLRTFEQLGSNVIAPLVSQLKMGKARTQVVWLDEIFDHEKYESDLLNNPLWRNYPYEYRKMKYFDRVQFNLEIGRFL